MEAIWVYFGIGLLATFIGTIPFGPINLYVVDTTLKKSFHKGIQFSISASAIEIVQVLLAIFFGISIEQFLQEHSWVQVLIFTIFIALGVFNLLRKTKTPSVSHKKSLKIPEFVKGLLVAITNPQAIPFWIVTFAFISQSITIDFMSSSLPFFLIGVFFGKLLALTLFGVLSTLIQNRLNKSYTFINKSLGSVLLVIGLVQAYNYFFV